MTGGDFAPTDLPIGRAPLPLETSVAGVFAIGDVRAGSTKRVAAAVGEGAAVVAQIHAALANWWPSAKLREASGLVRAVG